MPSAPRQTPFQRTMKGSAPSALPRLAQQHGSPGGQAPGAFVARGGQPEPDDAGQAALLRVGGHDFADDGVGQVAARFHHHHIARLRQFQRLVHQQIVAGAGAHRQRGAGQRMAVMHGPQARAAGRHARHAVADVGDGKAAELLDDVARDRAFARVNLKTDHWGSPDALSVDLARSLLGDAGFLHDLAENVVVGAMALAQIRRRARHDAVAGVFKLLHDIRLRLGFIQRLVQCGDHVVRRLAGRHQPPPDRLVNGLETAFREGRHIRQRR
ncbi:hypothetical protein G6F24_014021 [Rhizopus arrhizus]|nr:hypothetical protein G6F24_014021 [Rhizopus arrhizus]